jgi:hypothetical protein
VVSIAVLVMGVPLLVWWVGGRLFWGRLRPGADPDPWGDRMRRFGLTPGEAAQVESAVAWGVELHDDRLRRAAVTLAEEQLEDGASAHARLAGPWPSGWWSPPASW